MAWLLNGVVVITTRIFFFSELFFFFFRTQEMCLSSHSDIEKSNKLFKTFALMNSFYLPGQKEMSLNTKGRER